MAKRQLPKSAIIIGAGAGGLALANILAKRGMAVTVYEQHGAPGGRAGSWKTKGFTFDTGPSWYLMPEVFEHYFSLLGEDLKQHLALQRLDPGYRVLAEKNKSYDIRGALKADEAIFESLEAGSPKALRSYLKSAAKTYELATKYFLYNNFESPRGLLHWEVIAGGLSMATMASRTMHGHISRYMKRLETQQILEYPAVFLGASPFKAPALYSLMSHLDFTQGVYYPKGGMYTLIEALVSIGKKYGVRYEYGQQVAAIDIQGGHAKGIRLAGGGKATADIIISNADLHFTETQLVPKQYQTYPARYWQKREPGPSALLMYLGIKGKLPNLQHHNLIFSHDWETGFKRIFDQKAWPEKASMYICVPSKTDRSVAPKGYENVFVLVPGPAVDTMDASERDALAAQYLDQLIAMTGATDLKDRIVVQRNYGPGDFASDFNAWHGTALGLGHTLRQSAMFRPGNRSRKVDNLYYVGGNTVPGIGLPMCLIGAELVYKRLIGDTSAGPLGEL